jgi:hypothetical protein
LLLCLAAGVRPDIELECIGGADEQQHCRSDRGRAMAGLAFDSARWRCREGLRRWSLGREDSGLCRGVIQGRSCKVSTMELPGHVPCSIMEVATSTA